MLGAGCGEGVFATIADVEAFAEWRNEVNAVRVLSRSPLRWQEESEDGPITYEVTERVEGRRLVVRIADADLPFGGTWRLDSSSENMAAELPAMQQFIADLPALTEPNVDLVTTGIERITASGVRTRDGVDHDLDVLILGTGFTATDFLAPAVVVLIFHDGRLWLVAGGDVDQLSFETRMGQN